MALKQSVSRRALLAALLATSTKSSNAQNTAQPFALPDIPGPLRPLGGLVIAPEALGGGGFSGAHLAPDLTLTLISDRGHWAEARLLLDGLLGGARPAGYANQPKSHNAVAAAVAQGRADWGVAIASVARGYGLGVLPLADEQYDFFLPEARAQRPAVQAFLTALRSAEVTARLVALGFTPAAG